MSAASVGSAIRRRLSLTTAMLLAGALTVPSLTPPAFAQEQPAAAQAPTVQPPAAPSLAPTHGPASVADLAEGLLGAVVNISTSQNVKGTEAPNAVPMPQLPEGSPFQDFFDDFFKNREGEGGPGGGQKVQSLGSGFVVDAEPGILVTNNHVIADADEIEVNFPDGSKLKAELVGTDTKTDLAVLQGRSDAEEADRGEVRRFRQDAHRRLGYGDRQPVRPGRHCDGGYRLGAQPRHQRGPL
jgi:serine protease Do